MGLFSSSSKSTAASTQTAIDKRQVAYDAPATSIDISNSGSGKYASTTAHVNVINNMLDGGAIDAAFKFADDSRIDSFTFAEESLNKFLALAINSQKTAQAAANAVTDSAANAINEISKKADGEVFQYKNWMLAVGLAAGAFWLWKAKK